MSVPIPGRKPDRNGAVGSIEGFFTNALAYGQVALEGYSTFQDAALARDIQRAQLAAPAAPAAVDRTNQQFAPMQINGAQLATVGGIALLAIGGGIVLSRLL